MLLTNLLNLNPYEYQYEGLYYTVENVIGWRSISDCIFRVDLTFGRSIIFKVATPIEMVELKARFERAFLNWMEYSESYI